LHLVGVYIIYNINDEQSDKYHTSKNKFVHSLRRHAQTKIDGQSDLTGVPHK